MCFLASRETNSDFATAIVKQKKVFRRGEYLYRIGESFQAFYALRCGSVKTYLFTDDGRVQVTGFHIAGELLGLDAIATSRHNCEAKVLETTSACEVPYLHFEK
ncbi:MAG: cyclic nucleotide-binding domain-containing protein, partial [Gammaproteobacteria bacterium]|nr:cyclic nucleotide-binding domain-containing protein [Gammaproteobacteria bacterium]